MIKQMSSIVLAGGKSQRYGSNKAIAELEGKTLISLSFNVLNPLVNELIVVVASHEQAKLLPLEDKVKVVVDQYPNCGSLGGIYSGLNEIKNEWAFVSACDMPFLNQNLITNMAELRDGHDIVAPIIENRPEPTHAMYRKSCLKSINKQLNSGELKITRFYNEMNVKEVHSDFIDKIDPGRWSFFNVNTPEDMIKAKQNYQLSKLDHHDEYSK
ncbi:MAG: molybdopterin-guanine dinucleotide biosynthesis protein A [Chloroflexi bacterium]|jgi:molybdopterin-guanine dinucleotide biosynthesis protein A|nr:MAG: molybdopterin-guanine dinucleotide biosynthesis protein A [Chloroflexota bacterium]